MYRMTVVEDEEGNYIVDNDDGSGKKGLNLGKKIEDLPGRAFVIKAENGDAHMACHMGDEIMVIINNSEIERED